jgi:hypothetical protein
VSETKTQNTSNSTARPEYLLHLLDSEINQIISQEKKPGWTTWILYASIATLFWILLAQLDNIDFNFCKVLIIVIILSLATDLIIIFTGFFSLIEESRLRDNRYFYFSRLIQGKRLLLFLLTLRFFIILLLINNFSYVLNTYSFTSISVLYILYTLSLFILLVLSFLNIPLPLIAGEQKKLKFVVMLVPFLITIYTLSHYYYYYKDNISSINEFKIGSIIAALIYLVILLSSQKSNTPLLSSLISIRRNFGINKISYEEAIQQTDIALLGLRINDVLQDNVRRILDWFERINIEYDEMISNINAFKNDFPADLKELTKEKCSILKAVIDSVSNHFDKISHLLDDAKKEKNKFEWKLILLNIKKTAPKEIQEIRDKFNKEIDKMDAKLQEASQGLEIFKKVSCLSCDKKCPEKKKLTENEQ